ncbi:MAG: hypothetical protein MPJ50_18560 [Pirellulales bacterium]|nr:hypothetical protein [Pirellulales bacterium]
MRRAWALLLLATWLPATDTPLLRRLIRAHRYLDMLIHGHQVVAQAMDGVLPSQLVTTCTVAKNPFAVTQIMKPIKSMTQVTFMQTYCLAQIPYFSFS